MTQQLEAVFGGGLLRPLEPLSLQEKQHVLLTISDVSAPRRAFDGLADQEWLRHHSEEYRGQWVALDGGSLLSHGPDARAVRDEARSKGVPLPLLAHIPDEPNLTSAGWL